MVKPITMRELQKLSANAIDALPHTVPVKSGNRTVAMLVPVRGLDPDRAAKIAAWEQAVDTAAAARTPAQNAAIDAYLGELGFD